MLSAVSALGAQNIGAKKPERAVKTLRYAVMLATGFGIFVALLMQFVADPVVSLFVDPSEAGGAKVVRTGGKDTA